MAKKKKEKTVEVSEIIDKYLEISDDLKMIEERKKYLENNDLEDSLVILALLEIKIQKRKKYLNKLLKTKVIISSNF